MSSATRILTPLRIAFLALLEAGFMVVSAFALPAHALWNGSAPVGADTITTGSSKAEDEADATHPRTDGDRT
jgi:hypothetical protein